MRQRTEVFAASVVTAGLAATAGGATRTGSVLVAAGTYALLLPRLFRSGGRPPLD